MSDFGDWDLETTSENEFVSYYIECFGLIEIGETDEMASERFADELPEADYYGGAE